MPSVRRVRAIFSGATALRADGPGESGRGAKPAPECGVLLAFRPERVRLDVDRIEDVAWLGPELDIPSVAGLGKVVRVLRAARVAPPSDVEALLGRADDAVTLLERAVGTPLALELRPRSRVRFTAWTDAGIETVDDVTEVLEGPDAWLVLRQKGRFPVRVPREAVVRQYTESERWYEVIDIERG